jgi:P-type Mg2+ transporter
MLYQGLTHSEVEKSLQKHGKNTVRVKSVSAFALFKRQFANPLVYLLIVAGLISYWLKDYNESIAIFIILFINAAIGFFQEYRSKKLIANISSYISSKVEVIRDGIRTKINKDELVVDDIILLKLGDIVPADCVILKADDIRVDESILTGESEIIHKTALVLLREAREEKHLLYAGSTVAYGFCVARVMLVGEQTRFGVISHLTLNTKKPSQFEKNTADLSRGFSIVGVAFLFIILGLQIFLKPGGVDRWADLALFTITLTISLVPEALPVITSLAIAQKAFGLGKKGLIIRHQTALEDLGNIDVLCTDKTGTLTENKQSIADYDIEKPGYFSYIWLLTIDSNEDIDIAVKNWLKDHKKINKKQKLTLDEYTDIPFDPQRRLSGRILKDTIIYKGSVESILDLCEVSKKKREAVIKNVRTKSTEGLRAIAYACKSQSSGEKIYLGTIFLADEIKSDADDVVRACVRNGVELKILTGDSLEVAIYIARKAGLITSSDECVDASQLPFHDEILLEHIIKSKKVFARTKPEDKYTIIKILQKNHVVGYLGDGINDAPALALAQVGIVVDTASDIAKATADIIILKHGLNVIINGVREGRAVFENIQKYLRFTLIGNFGNSFTIGLISLLLPFEPILAIQILIINLLTDLPMLAISNDNVELSDLKSPKKQELHKLLLLCVSLGLISTFFDFIFFAINRNLPADQIQTMWFLFSISTELLLIFSIRSSRVIFRSVAPHALLLNIIFFSFVTGLWLALTGFHFLNIAIIPVQSLVLISILATLYLITSEVGKNVFYKIIENKKSYD